MENVKRLIREEDNKFQSSEKNEISEHNEDRISALKTFLDFKSSQA